MSRYSHPRMAVASPLATPPISVTCSEWVACSPTPATRTSTRSTSNRPASSIAFLRGHAPFMWRRLSRPCLIHVKASCARSVPSSCSYGVIIRAGRDPAPAAD